MEEKSTQDSMQALCEDRDDGSDNIRMPCNTVQKRGVYRWRHDNFPLDLADGLEVEEWKKRQAEQKQRQSNLSKRGQKHQTGEQEDHHY